MSKDYKTYFKDIVDAIEKIDKYTKDCDFEKFKSSSLISDAVIRNLAIIGEAVKNIPAEVKKDYDEIEWKKIAGFRDMVIHSYSNVDLEIVWDVVENKLSELKRTCEKVI
ncbi:MAG: DUF86 domain-containing protein [Nanoarchaeota archaeon]|nr:DUF86 domain-containing protein [Nanoarchaeota archaeon]